MAYLRTSAKINLGLHVTERRPDGYHNLETIFYPIPLCDVLEVNPIKCTTQSYRLHLSGIPVSGPPNDNLVIKVYEKLKQEFDLPPVEILLFKRIPTGAGLGGGSSDAAAMMLLLNEIFELKLTAEQMEQRIAPIGADCPFFIQSKPVLATGIGNVFSPIDISLKGYTLVLVKPNVSISTAEAYSQVSPHLPEVSLSKLSKQHIAQWRDTLINDFEPSVFAIAPTVAAIKQTLYELGAVYASMSGSGSAVFGLFEIPPLRLEKLFGDCFYYQHVLS